MELRLGYKQTELGIIPEDWAVKCASQISHPVRGGSPRPAGDPKYFNGSFIPWLTVASLTNIPLSKLFVTETAASLTEEGSHLSRTLNKGTLILANSGATLGIAKILGIKCCANDGIAAFLSLHRDISPAYLAHYINTRTNYLREVVATGNGQPNLNTDLIGGFKFPLPPTKAEQEAIAEALTDADALIESLEQLIAKKRHLKQGALQELLTGKRRLPGFCDEWNSRLFGDLAQPRTERVDPRKTGVLDFCIELEHIQQESGCLVGSRAVGEECSLKSVFNRGDVLFGKLRAYLRKYWLAERSGVCSTEVWVLAAQADQIVPEFLFQLVKTDGFIEAASSAYGTHMPRSDWKAVKNYPLIVPGMDEQNVIAAILSDMDADITALETKLTKSRQIKQGMMHNLLTGKIRLR